MLVKLLKDHHVGKSHFCGEVREIIQGTEYSPNIAIFMDIHTTEAHFHNGFDEIYFVLDGYINVLLHDPAVGIPVEQMLKANELCVINKGVHHKIIESSVQNRLCVITIPAYDANDAHSSNLI